MSSYEGCHNRSTAKKLFDTHPNMMIQCVPYKVQTNTVKYLFHFYFSKISKSDKRVITAEATMFPVFMNKSIYIFLKFYHIRRIFPSMPASPFAVFCSRSSKLFVFFFLLQVLFRSIPQQ